MIQIKLWIAVILMSVLTAGTGFGQNQNAPKRIKNKKAAAVDTRIDNMGYWRQKAAEGLVPVAQPIPVAPAKYTGSLITAKSVKSGKEDSPDVAVTELTNVTESENSIFVDPSDNNHVLNSNNSISLSVNIYGANYFLSDDGGQSWGGSEQGAGGPNSGDPTTAINLDGSRMYVNYISNNGGQGIAFSTTGGASWITKSVAPNPGSLADKNHMWIDNSPASPYEGNLYIAYTAYGGANDSEILMTRSTDEGNTWSSPMNISAAINAGSHNQGVNIQTGPGGEVYACWVAYDGWPADEKAIGFSKSSDGGATYSTATRIIDNIRGIRTTGIQKTMRVNSFPVMAVDISSGTYSGNIYIVWSNIGVPGENLGTDASVYMIRSEDEGETWSTPIKINQDAFGAGKKHYLPWITCDPTSGILSAIWYDDRNVGASQCEVYCANSSDGGETWEDFKVSDVSFTITPVPGLSGNYMGDYLGISAYGSKVYPCWTDARTGIHMTYTSPYETNNLPKPTDLSIALNEESGDITLAWLFDPVDDFIAFYIYRDGEPIGSTTELTFADVLPNYGIFTYSVTAMHDDGESVASSGSVQWGNAQIDVDPGAVNAVLPVGGSTTKTFAIENVGELELQWNMVFELTSEKDPKAYCTASGGGDEFISHVTFGDIDNASGANGYSDYTSMSTTVSLLESYDITVENGNVYQDDDLGIWIDWNQDDDFEDAGENVVCDADNSGEGTFSITVPGDAQTGTTRMRVRIKYYDSDCGDPCGNTQFGEVEDYSLNVQGWLIVNPTMGVLNAGESQSINVILDAADLTDGIYTASLHLNSNDPDNETVTVPVTLLVGEGILLVGPTANPDKICEGESVQLMASVEGGSGTYTYNWTSDPSGFTSSEADPVISPTETTMYMVVVSDGTYNANGQVEVEVNPIPEVMLDDYPMVYLNTPPFELSGGTPAGGVYSGPGVEAGMMYPENAGLGTHMITYTYEENGCENFAEATIVVDEPVAINEYVNGLSVQVFPNPNKGEFIVQLNALESRKVNLKVLNNLGVEVYSVYNVNVKNSWKKNIDLSYLSEGIYFINLYTEETSILKKMVLRK